MCNKLTMVYVSKNNYVINNNKNEMAQGSGQRAEAQGRG